MQGFPDADSFAPKCSVMIDSAEESGQSLWKQSSICRGGLEGARLTESRRAENGKLLWSVSEPVLENSEPESDATRQLSTSSVYSAGLDMLHMVLAVLAFSRRRRLSHSDQLPAGLRLMCQ